MLKDASAEFCATTTQSDVLIAPRNNRAMKVSCEYVPQYISQSGKVLLQDIQQLADEMNRDIVGEKLQNWSTRRRLMN